MIFHDFCQRIGWEIARKRLNQANQTKPKESHGTTLCFLSFSQVFLVLAFPSFLQLFVGFPQFLSRLSLSFPLCSSLKFFPWLPTSAGKGRCKQNLTGIGPLPPALTFEVDLSFSLVPLVHPFFLFLDFCQFLLVFFQFLLVFVRFLLVFRQFLLGFWQLSKRIFLFLGCVKGSWFLRLFFFQFPYGKATLKILPKSRATKSKASK